MDRVSEEQRTFETMKADLVRSHPGRFAVICGPRLLGVFESVDEALLASSRAFDARQLPEGTPGADQRDRRARFRARDGAAVFPSGRRRVGRYLTGRRS